jgi:hypothetical protein
MGFFSKKKTKESEYSYVYLKAYFIIDGNLYRFYLGAYIKEEDLNGSLSSIELFQKYGNDGIIVNKYDIKNIGNISYKDAEKINRDGMYSEYSVREHYNSFDELPFDMSNVREVYTKDLYNAINEIKMNFEKQFKEFPLDGTLYRAKHNRFDNAFKAIVKPKRKLVDENETKLSSSLILEIEVLDGKSAETKREFIPFYIFVEDYTPECGIEVVESSDVQDFKIKDYFK